MDTDKAKFVARSVIVGSGHIPVKVGLLRNKTQLEESKLLPDLDAMCEQLAQVYTDLDAQGYEVVNLMPINVGELIENKDRESGISVTRGAVVVGRLVPAD